MADADQPLIDAAIDPADVLDAARRIAPYVGETPVLARTALDRVAGRPVLIKAEALQVTGSFKARGAFNRLLAMGEVERSCGIVAWSAGNHGRALAHVGAMLGIGVTIVMPADAPRTKIEATRGLGATVRLYDRASEDREVIGRAIADETGAVIVPPYEDRHVIAGGGTAGLELLEESHRRGVPLGSLVVCTGGGGLVAGCALAMATRTDPVAVWSVEPEGYDDTRRSLGVGRRVRNDGRAASSADALLTVTPGAMTFALNWRLLAGGLVVTEAEIASAVRFAFEELKLVVEPGGAAALAAVLAGKVPEGRGALGVILTGGNVDAGVHARLVAEGQRTW